MKMHYYTREGVSIENIFWYIALVVFVISLVIGYMIHVDSTKEGIKGTISILWAGSPLMVWTVVYWLFEHYLWKIFPINSFLKIPDLEGEYKGTLKSSFDNFEIKYPIKLRIRQTFSRISILMEMENASSKSYSLNAFLENRGEEILLIYNYQNEPLDRKKATLNEHKGTAILKFSSDSSSFTGNYFTDKRPKDREEAICNYGEMNGKRVR